MLLLSFQVSNINFVRADVKFIDNISIYWTIIYWTICQSYLIHSLFLMLFESALFTLFRMGGYHGWMPKRRTTRFSPATSTNVGISPKNFLTLNFNPFATLANFKATPSVSRKLLNLNQDHFSRKRGFLVKSL